MVNYNLKVISKIIYYRYEIKDTTNHQKRINPNENSKIIKRFETIDFIHNFDRFILK